MLIDKFLHWYKYTYLSICNKYKEIHIEDNMLGDYGKHIFYNIVHPYYKFDTVVVMIDVKLLDEQIEQLAQAVVSTESLHSDNFAPPRMNTLIFKFWSKENEIKYNEYYTEFKSEDLLSFRNVEYLKEGEELC